MKVKVVYWDDVPERIQCEIVRLEHHRAEYLAGSHLELAKEVEQKIEELERPYTKEEVR